MQLDIADAVLICVQ